MKIGKEIKSILTILILIILFAPEFNVEAAKNPDSDQLICIRQNVYQVTKKGSNVVLGQITSSDLSDSGEGCFQGRYVTNSPIETNIYENKKQCVEENKFTAISMGIACKRNPAANGGYTFETCPTELDQTTATSMTEVTKSTEMVWNGSSWTMTMRNASGYKVIKVVNTNRICKDADCLIYDFAETSGSWIYPNSDGVISINVAPGEEYYYAFYLNTGSVCDSSYMGYSQGVGSLSIPNPYKNSARCQLFESQIQGYNSAAQNIARSIYYQCYEDNISYLNRSIYTDRGSQSAYDQAINFVRTYQLSSGTVNDALQCSFQKEKNGNYLVNSDSSKSYVQILPTTENNTYWKAVCTETLKIEYQTPRGVSAGQGFSYSPTITVERTCIPVQVKVPVMKEACQFGVECWGGPANHHGESGAGPNEEFDQCVQTCDGGKYSQSCIDKCYENVYGTTKTSNNSINTKVSRNLYDETYTVARVASGYPQEGDVCGNGIVIGQKYAETKLPVSSCHVQSSIDGCQNVPGSCPICTSLHGYQYIYCTTCNDPSNPTKCYEVYKSSTKCALNPQQDYEDQMRASQAELDKIHEDIAVYITDSNESFSASILDSHTGKTQEYKDATGAEVQVTAEKSGDKDYSSTLTNQTADMIGTTPTTVKTYTVTRKLKLQLDYGYVSKTTAFDTIYGKNYFDTHASIQKNYYAGENKYFTNLNARGVNLYEKWPTIIGFDNEEAIDEFNENLVQNIKYNFQNLGTWAQWSNIDLDCFYGIKVCSGITSNQDEECIPGNNDIAGTGITFIYRPIDLNSPFVERDPRWNWSTNATNGKYNINPSETLQDIVDKGYDIYRTSNQSSAVEVANNDLDYEIILTKQNINAIRQYNREKEGEYLNYDMYCYVKDGANVCRSSFLGSENASNDTYMKILKRGLIGCNNQASPDSCDRTYTDVRKKVSN